MSGQPMMGMPMMGAPMGSKNSQKSISIPVKEEGDHATGTVEHFDVPDPRESKRNIEMMMDKTKQQEENYAKQQ